MKFHIYIVNSFKFHFILVTVLGSIVICISFHFILFIYFHHHFAGLTK